MAELWSRPGQPARCWRLSRRGLAALGIALLALSACPPLMAATFTATLDRNVINVGETTTYTLRVDGGSPRVFPNPPPVPHLRWGGGQSSQGYTAVNGVGSSFIAQSFTVSADQPGDYTIPPVQIDVDGQGMSSPTLRLKVVKDDNNRLAFLKISTPKKEAYIGEVVPVEFQIYIRDNINGGGFLQQFENYTGCPLKADGFSILKTGHGPQRHVQEGGVGYNVATLITGMSPVKAGTLTISGMEIQLPMQIPQGSPGFFQRFEYRQLNLAADPVSINVQPVPRANAPPFFTGAVGVYSMAVSATPTNVAVGEPVTVRVQISGRGALDSLSLPEQPAWRDFKTYPPTSKVDTTDSIGMQGTKIFDIAAIPQNAELKDVPPVSFSFFNPDRKTYQTLTQPAIPIIVRPGGSVSAPVLPAANQAQENAPPAQDIVHIKPRLGTITRVNAPLLQRPLFLAFQCLPIALFVGVLAWRRRADGLENNPRLRRQRQVALLVSNGLAELRAQAAANNSEAFFATLVHLLQEQLGERLDVPASAITESVVDERLRPRGVPEPLLNAVHELFQLCNLVRYAPIKTSQELAALIPRLESVLSELQDLKV
jgi:hypothetical protein